MRLVYFYFEDATAEVEGARKRCWRRQLLSPGERAATNLLFTVHCGKSGFLGGEGGWQQMKLAGCGVLFSPASRNEQASRAGPTGGMSPRRPEPSLFHPSAVLSMRGRRLETHR